VRVVVFAGDHGVARTAGTSAYPPEVTAQMVLNLVAGGAGVSVLARTNGAGVRVLDLAVDVDYADLGAVVPDDVVHAKVRRGSGSIDVEDALTREQAEAALAAGARIADEEVDAGADLLVPGDMGIGNTTPAAALIGLLTGHDPPAWWGGAPASTTPPGCARPQRYATRCDVAARSWATPWPCSPPWAGPTSRP
jgi:nicotinate-nucleotide--dimethylbenzimidazole phosphoribosyltransferase